MKAGKKRLTTAVALAAGVCIFAGAAFASYNTSNGYATYKKAVFAAAESDNYTISYKLNAYVDGKPIDGEYTEVIEKFSAAGDANLSRTSNAAGYKTKSYIQDNKMIDISPDGRATVYDMDRNEWKPEEFRTFNVLDSRDDGEKKVLRFAELLADTLIGDIKNNFVYVSGDRNTDKYEMKLSSVQIPELFNAGLAAAFGVNGIDTYETPEYNENDLYTVLGGDPTIDSVSCEFEVDNDGRLTYNLLSAQASGIGFDGNKHTAKLEIEIKMSDYGATVPDKVDLDSLKNVQWIDSENSVSYIKTTDNGPVAVMGDGSERPVELGKDGVIISIAGLDSFDTGVYEAQPDTEAE